MFVVRQLASKINTNYISISVVSIILLFSISIFATGYGLQEALTKEGKGYVVASLGVDSGYVPYTAYSAKQSYLKAHPEVIQGFTNALQKGMDYVQSHTPEEIAQVIAPQFAETDLADITTIVTRYYEQDTWKDNLIFEEKSFELLQDILAEAEELESRVPYEALVTTEFAEKAVEK